MIEQINKSIRFKGSNVVIRLAEGDITVSLKAWQDIARILSSDFPTDHEHWVATKGSKVCEWCLNTFDLPIEPRRI